MSGLVILITGRASGISAATAKDLQANGAMPVLIDCDAAQLKNAASELNAPSFCVDVTDYAACQAAVAQTLASYGRPWPPMAVHGRHQRDVGQRGYRVFRALAIDYIPRCPNERCCRQPLRWKSSSSKPSPVAALKLHLSLRASSCARSQAQLMLSKSYLHQHLSG